MSDIIAFPPVDELVVDRFASKRLTAPEWPLIREYYQGTYPVRPLINHVDELVAALREIIRRADQGRHEEDFDSISSYALKAIAATSGDANG